ncbi:MAG: HU family DNA-binding protein [Oscillospiraceae bacterium]|nr:HU family DNA-binding protein [Oscillospiraceae bacterium]
MNKAELVSAVAEKAGLSKKDSEKAINAAFESITETLAAGEKVQLVGFGAFEVKERNARIGRNPKTKEEIQIPASRVASFKVGKALKDAIAK